MAAGRGVGKNNKAFPNYFQTTFQHLLLGKLYNFRRRSLWRYLLAALLLSLARPALLGGFWQTWLALSLGLGALGLGVLFLSSYWQRHRTGLDAKITFRTDQIVVRPADAAQPAQTKDWRWILRADESGSHFFLLIGQVPRQYLLLRKAALTAAEVTTFRQWLARREARRQASRGPAARPVPSPPPPPQPEPRATWRRLRQIVGGAGANAKSGFGRASWRK